MPALGMLRIPLYIPKEVEIKDAKGVPSYNPCGGEAGVGVGKEVESVLAAFLKDVQHPSKMMTKPKDPSKVLRPYTSLFV